MKSRCVEEGDLVISVMMPKYPYSDIGFAEALGSLVLQAPFENVSELLELTALVEELIELSLLSGELLGLCSFWELLVMALELETLLLLEEATSLFKEDEFPVESLSSDSLLD